MRRLGRWPCMVGSPRGESPECRLNSGLRGIVPAAGLALGRIKGDRAQPDTLAGAGTQAWRRTKAGPGKPGEFRLNRLETQQGRSARHGPARARAVTPRPGGATHCGHSGAGRDEPGDADTGPAGRQRTNRVSGAPAGGTAAAAAPAPAPRPPSARSAVCPARQLPSRVAQVWPRSEGLRKWRVPAAPRPSPASTPPGWREPPQPQNEWPAWDTRDTQPQRDPVPLRSAPAATCARGQSRAASRDRSRDAPGVRPPPPGRAGHPHPAPLAGGRRGEPSVASPPGLTWLRGGRAHSEQQDQRGEHVQEAPRPRPQPRPPAGDRPQTPG